MKPSRPYNDTATGGQEQLLCRWQDRFGNGRKWWHGRDLRERIASDQRISAELMQPRASDLAPSTVACSGCQTAGAFALRAYPKTALWPVSRPSHRRRPKVSLEVLG